MLARLATHRYALRMALGGLGLALLAYGLLANAPKSRRLAPPLPAHALSGEATTLARLRGHAAVVVFFASWCTPCRHDAPAVARFASSPAGHGHVVAVDYNDAGDWRAFLHRYRWRFPVFDDSSGETGAAYGIARLPTVVFLSPHSQIVALTSGPQTVASLTSGLTAAA